MKNSWLYLIPILLLIIINSFCFLKQRHVQNKFTVLEDEVGIIIKENIVDNQIDSLGISFYNIQIKPNTIIENSNGQASFISEISNNGHLYLWYSQSVCSSCIDTIMTKLTYYQVDSSMVFILTSTKNNNKSLFLRNRTKYKFIIYNILDEQSFPLEKYDQPIFFQINDQLQIINPHIFQIAKPSRTDIYLKRMKTSIL